ncbi:4'-phosphopantetheinyl transferase superfamily protein [Winogradskyella sp. DF17]|uniref:4'-phosphopantetheinyl transferase superfamily protein n=1 Tax=Winogradskyella pelagia TaxID=2819984 RepID=A0ABS3SXT4_9FLAO|nr:4'-phosphopantetheinyl transferase superfamily protein [Winogradskyella sp. DF17]MBO3115306.1 4'-phosphopantetheinyl transferase superfamily protein [Winogradskyella sp. DF17]
MVGNDIIDIAEAKISSNYKRPRFLETLFSLKEQQHIYNSNNPFQTVWRLWSMKEAAYKLYTQGSPSRFYNPKKFECFIEATFGIVKFRNFKCYVATEITLDYIISEARLKPLTLNSEVVKFNSKHLQNQSEFLKSKLIRSISKKFHIPESELAFKKNNYGIPTVEFNEIKKHISLTHHGNFGAFAIS